MCLEICQLDPARCFTLPGLAWQAALKKTKVKLDLLTDIDMLLMVEGSIRGGTCYAIYRYAKANNKYMKNMVKTKNRHILKFGYNLHGWSLSQKLPVNKLKWVEDISEFDESFIKSYNKGSG